MSKKKKANIKLKKLIQQRLKEAQKSPSINKKTKSPKSMISMEKSPKSNQNITDDFNQIKPDLRKIGLTVLTIILFLVIIFLIDAKKPFLDPLATKLSELFQKE